MYVVSRGVLILRGHSPIFHVLDDILFALFSGEVEAEFDREIRWVGN